MDGDLEKVHEVLLNAGFETNITELKTPTSEFMINLITKFLTRFYIDATTIQRLTFVQQQALTYPEVYYDIIGLINLHVATAGICKQIFLKDFCITDITSPSPKRARKQAGLLSNFVLYTNNKISEVEDSVNNILARGKTLQSLVQKKNAVIESINQNALHNSKQLVQIEKYKKEIEEIRSRIEKNKKREIEIKELVREVEHKRQIALQQNVSLKTEALKHKNIIAKLDSMVVRAPEEYKTHMNELKKDIKKKKELREAKQDAIQAKKHSIEQMEKIIIFINQQLEKFPEVKEIYERFKEANEKLEGLTKQIKEVNAAKDKLIQELALREHECAEQEISDLHLQCEQRLSPLRILQVQLLCERKLMREKLEKMQQQQYETIAKKDNISKMIVKLEEEMSVLVKECQELYEKEIADEIKLRNTWKDLHK